MSIEQTQRIDCHPKAQCAQKGIEIDTQQRLLLQIYGNCYPLFAYTDNTGEKKQEQEHGFVGCTMYTVSLQQSSRWGGPFPACDQLVCRWVRAGSPGERERDPAPESSREQARKGRLHLVMPVHLALPYYMPVLAANETNQREPANTGTAIAQERSGQGMRPSK